MKIGIYLFSFIILSQNAIAIPSFENDLQERARGLTRLSDLKHLSEQREQMLQLKISCEIENSSFEIPLNCYKYLALLKKHKISAKNLNAFEIQTDQNCEIAARQQKIVFPEIKTSQISSNSCQELVREKNAEILYIQQSNYK